MNSTQDALLQPVTNLSGVGNAVADKLTKLGIKNIKDVLLHLPSRYIDKTRITPLDSVQIGDLALIQGEVVSSRIIFGKKRMLIVSIKDQDGFLKLRFFHFNQKQKDSFTPGKIIRCFGEVRNGPNGYEMIHPEYVLNPKDANTVEDKLTPIYPLVQGVNQKLIQSIASQAINLLSNSAALSDVLPEYILDQFSLMPLKNALQQLHKPDPDVAIDLLESMDNPAKYRLVFEELLAYQLLIKKLRLTSPEKTANPTNISVDLQNKFIGSLGFSLTNAQQRVIQEIFDDMKKTIPMRRLVQGDVGCGKTVVAALAALAAVCNNTQAVIMAPTEILAEQHYKNFRHWFESLGYEVSFLSGGLKKSIRDHELEKIAQNNNIVIIGTHAVFQEKVKFNNLGLVIIDEQHRFGVNQRLELLGKVDGDTYPHQLVMSATPIPRTMAMALYADLSVSIIDEMPKGRKEVTTVVLPNEKRMSVVERIKKILNNGLQAYWVCPLIEESEKISCNAAIEIGKHLSEELSDYNVEVVHGRMKSQEKEYILHKFKSREIDLLVSTTVVEVGVDVPNASLMVIENAERLGLSQLHQLRGRVGRGNTESFCILMYQSPLSQTARKRLDIMRKTNDGFQIARLDLEIRGVGEMFGTNQTGINNMRIANIGRDHKMLEIINPLAESLLKNDPKVADGIIQRWLQNKEHFANT